MTPRETNNGIIKSGFCRVRMPDTKIRQNVTAIMIFLAVIYFLSIIIRAFFLLSI